MDGGTLFWGLLIGYVVWMFYMMTFRTGDFLALMKADHERKKALFSGLGWVAKFVAWIGLKFLGR